VSSITELILQNRNRTCNNPETAFGGIFCSGLSDEQVTISPTFYEQVFCLNSYKNYKQISRKKVFCVALIWLT